MNFFLKFLFDTCVKLFELFCPPARQQENHHSSLKSSNFSTIVVITFPKTQITKPYSLPLDKELLGVKPLGH